MKFNEKEVMRKIFKFFLWVFIILGFLLFIAVGIEIALL